MKRLALLFSCTAIFLSAADLSEVHNVYVLKMTKGLDQYLANHLTSAHLFQVVTDPKMADTILTDQIGEGFQAKLDELFPPPESEKPEPPEKPAKPEKPEKAGDAAVDLALVTDTVNKLGNPGSNSSFGRAKGIVFLVDPKSKQVIWSTYSLPKGNTSAELDHTALDIVSRIKRDMKKK